MPRHSIPILAVSVAERGWLQSYYETKKDEGVKPADQEKKGAEKWYIICS